MRAGQPKSASGLGAVFVFAKGDGVLEAMCESEHLGDVAPQITPLGERALCPIGPTFNVISGRKREAEREVRRRAQKAASEWGPHPLAINSGLQRRVGRARPWPSSPADPGQRKGSTPVSLFAAI